MVATNWTDTSAKVRNTCDLVKRNTCDLVKINTCDLIKRNTNHQVQVWLRKGSYWHKITHKCTSHVSRISSKTFIFGWSIVEKQVVYLMRKITKVIQFNFSLQLFIYEPKKTLVRKLRKFLGILLFWLRECSKELHSTGRRNWSTNRGLSIIWTANKNLPEQF